MSRAVLFATEATADGGASALLGEGDRTLVERLAADLTALGADEVTVVTRPAWADALRARSLTVVVSPDVAGDLDAVARAAGAGAGVVLAAADVVAHRAALAQIARSGVRRTAAAIQAGPAADGGCYPQPIMRERDMVISVGTGYHRVTGPNAVFRGVLGVSAADSGRLASACEALRTASFDLSEAAAGGVGALGLLLLALVRDGVTVAGYNVRFLHCARAGSGPGAVAAVSGLASVDEERAALRAAIKEDDEFFATYAVNSYTHVAVRFFVRYGISPNAVTWLSTLIGLASAVAFAVGTRWGLVLGAFGFYASFFFDCCDGQVARFTGRYSRYGGWLDMMADRLKEYAAFAGLAIGGHRMGEPGVWSLALAAVCLQTVRHMIDTWYGAFQDTATRSLPAVALDSALDTKGLRAAGRHAPERVAVGAAGANAVVTVPAGGDGAAGIGATLGRLSAAAHGAYRSPAYWVKRSVVLPIGDRWLLIALSAALFGPRVSFIVLLVAASLAFGYVLAGRSLRALAIRVAPLPRYDIPRQRDDGVLARAIGRVAGRRFPPVPVALPALAASLAVLAAAIARHTPPTWVAPATAALALLAALGSAAPHTGALDWLTPAALRAMEYTFILAVIAVGHVPQPLGYGLLCALVFYHYDLAGRIEKQASPIIGTGLVRGWELRTVLLAAATIAGWATGAYVVGVVAIGGVVVIGSIAGWLRSIP